MKYGPLSYYTVGRIFPRSRLREPWSKQDRKPGWTTTVFPPPVVPSVVGNIVGDLSVYSQVVGGIQVHSRVDGLISVTDQVRGQVGRL
jgi:hypothetical protein